MINTNFNHDYGSDNKDGCGGIKYDETSSDRDSNCNFDIDVMNAV